GIIILFTFITVYSIFNIAVIGEIKTYSNLELIGVTQSQIKLLVFLQAFIVYILSAPVGLGIGWGVSILGLHMANYREIEYVSNNTVSYLACGRNAILLTFLAVVFSVMKPIRFIRRISPVEASVFSDVSLLKRKQRKPKEYSLADMAARNVLRFKGRNIYILLLYSLSIALFVGVTSFVKSVSLEKYMSQRQLPADIVVGTDDFVNRSMMTAGSCRSNSPNGQEGEIWTIKSQVLQKLRNTCGNARIEPYYYHYDMDINEDMKKRFLQVISDSSFRWEEDTEIYLLGKRLQEKGIEDSSLYLTDMRYFVEYETLEGYKIVEGALDRSKFESGDYVVLICSPYLGETGTLYHAGEKIVLSDWPDGVTTERKEDGSLCYQGNKDKEYTVLAVVEEVPVLYAQLDVPVACILPVRSLERYSGNDAPRLYAVALWGEQVEELEEKVAAVLEKNVEKLQYISYKSIKKELKRDVNQLAYIGYIIVLLGVALAFVNMQNSLQMGIVERKQEFKILRNLGMTGKQLLHMIHLENIILLSTGISGGFLVGIIGSNLLVRKFCDNFFFFDYKTAILPSILLSVGFILFAFIYPNKKTVL
ncbi:MAG: ABC transporter permease, partial [Clostridium sp.]|nr:ABC transporter permease [Clostridium sp.]